jgi:hypothetical protein
MREGKLCSASWLRRILTKLCKRVTGALADVFAAAKAINRKRDGLVEGPRIQLEGMLDPFRMHERHPKNVSRQPEYRISSFVLH